MYTYEEIREVLLEQISQLLKIELKWERCNACPNSGACCIGADIIVYNYEWNIIRKYLIENPDILRIIKHNFDSKSLCYFRTKNRCVIHDIRPINCIFTPYQALYGADKRIYYTPYKEDCSLLRSSNVSCKHIDLSQYFISLPDNCSSTWYLLLNHWYQDYEEKSIVHDTEKKMSDILERFLNQY